jgi:hypothetical protein
VSWYLNYFLSRSITASLMRLILFIAAVAYDLLSPSISISVFVSYSALSSRFRRNLKSPFDNRSDDSLVISYLPTHLLACFFDSVLVLVIAVNNFVWIDFCRIATFITIDVKAFKSLDAV